MVNVLIGAMLGAVGVAGVVAILVAVYKKGYRDAEAVCLTALKNALENAPKINMEDLMALTGTGTDTDKKNWN